MRKKVEEACEECKDSREAIWISCPWTEKEHEELLCEPCFNKLNVRSGTVNVKGSQWNGEELVEC